MECLCLNVPLQLRVWCVRACVRRSERLSKYNRYNHGRTLLLARQVVRSGRAHAVHVGWQSLQTVGVCVVGLPPLNSSAPHRFRHYYYFDIVSSCVLVAKCDNYLLIGGFSVGRGIFLTMVTACFILLSHDTVQTPFKVTESHLSILWSKHNFPGFCKYYLNLLFTNIFVYIHMYIHICTYRYM